MEYTHLCELLPAMGLGQAFSLSLHYFNFVIPGLLQGTVLSWQETEKIISLSRYYKTFNKGNILELCHIPQKKVRFSLTFSEVSFIALLDGT